jgi:hypothetical protein
MYRRLTTAYILFSIWLCFLLPAGCSAPTPTPTATLTATPAETPTDTPTATLVDTHTRIPTLAATPTVTPTEIPTDTVYGATVTGRVVLGYGSHSPVSDLPLWVGKESQGEPTTRTRANGEFILTDLPIGQVVDVVNSHLAFRVPITSGGTMDIGTLKYPLIHPPVYYWQTPEPLPDLSVVLSQGEPVQFTVCQTDATWRRPAEQEQREQVWSKRPSSDEGVQFLKHWFQRSAVIYDTMDVFVQGFPDGPQLDDIALDWHYLLGLWTSKKFSLSDSECAYGAQELEELLARKTVEVWLLNYQTNSVNQLGEHFAMDVVPCPGFQIIRFSGYVGPLTVHIIAEGEEIVQLPKRCRSSANPGCSD